MITKVPVATIEMQTGSIIKMELYYDIAPNTVKNFVTLANKGFYDGTIFHRVVKDFVIQGGDPTGTGTGGPGYHIKGEFYNPPAAYNSAGSQFFILHADAKYLDKDYAAFGMVTEGMDTVDAIATCVTGVHSKPIVEQKVKTIRVETFGQEIGEPEIIED